MNILPWTNYYPGLPVRPPVPTSTGAKSKVLAEQSVRPRWENFSSAAGDLGVKPTLPDEPVNLRARQALQAYLEFQSDLDQTWEQLWFRIDVYV